PTAITETYTLSLHDALPISLYAVPKVDNKQTETKENTTSKNEFLNSLAASQKAPEIQYKVTIPSDTDSLYKVLEENSVDINVKKDRKSTRLNSSHVSISYAV